ncbi:MAG: hypothetical protein RLZZ104_1538 [Pseudomonadota bacterium]|jgi:hypothetical protein
MTDDPLRFDFIIECSQMLGSYSRSIDEAAFRGNEKAVRVYFECLRAVAKDLEKTLREIEQAQQQQAKEAA